MGHRHPSSAAWVANGSRGDALSTFEATPGRFKARIVVGEHTAAILRDTSVLHATTASRLIAAGGSQRSRVAPDRHRSRRPRSERV